MFNAGMLRHRMKLQSPVETQDASTGAFNVTWTDIATVGAAIEPLSARDFVAAQSEQSKVIARLTICYRDDITAKMLMYHPVKNDYYQIEGVLADKGSGLEYLTLPVSILQVCLCDTIAIHEY